MAADAITAGLTFLFNTLHGDATLGGYISGVYQDVAPDGTTPIYCVIGVQSPGQDTLSANGYRILTRPIFMVKIMGPTAQMAQISTAYERADALLALVRNDAATGVIACVRVSPFYLPNPELINGEPWVSLGGLYRITY